MHFVCHPKGILICYYNSGRVRAICDERAFCWHRFAARLHRCRLPGISHFIRACAHYNRPLAGWLDHKICVQIISAVDSLLFNKFAHHTRHDPWDIVTCSSFFPILADIPSALQLATDPPAGRRPTSRRHRRSVAALRRRVPLHSTCSRTCVQHTPNGNRARTVRHMAIHVRKRRNVRTAETYQYRRSVRRDHADAGDAGRGIAAPAAESAGRRGACHQPGAARRTLRLPSERNRCP